MKCLKRLLPHALHKFTRMNSLQYVPATECRILSVVPEVAVPQPSSNIFRVDFIGVDDTVCVKWPGEIPTKCTNRLFFLYNYMFNSFFYYCSARFINKNFKSCKRTTI